jgi:hypothetical protein
MMENMKINKILPALRSTERIKKVDSRRQNNQQTPFNNLLKDKEEKEKKKPTVDPDLSHKNDSDGSSEKTEFQLCESKTDTDVKKISKNSLTRRLIDIRV